MQLCVCVYVCTQYFNNLLLLLLILRNIYNFQLVNEEMVNYKHRGREITAGVCKCKYSYARVYRFSQY